METFILIDGGFIFACVVIYLICLMIDKAEAKKDSEKQNEEEKIDG